MRYYIIAGEASGDLHGSNLIKAIKAEDPQAEIRAWGGDLMEGAGAQIVKHYRDLAFMGFVEVLANLRTILRNMDFCKKDITEFAPDAIIMIDYPGFNLRIAKWASPIGYKVLFYISPQVWAWKAKRVHSIKQHVDQLYTILPFEEAFYAKYDYPVKYVGHPLLDALVDYHVPKYFRKQNELPELPLIALLPGSRRQEIKKMLHQMLSVAPHFPGYHFVVAAAPSMPRSFYQEILDKHPSGNVVSVIEGQTYHLVSSAQAALVTSGTATLETALLNTPEVVCYRGNSISYLIARQLINIKYISLVNLIMDQPLVTELIQHDLQESKLVKELQAILKEPGRSNMLNGFARLREKLGNAGASARTAKAMIDFLKNTAQENKS